VSERSEIDQRARLDGRALRAGAGVALVVAVPFSIAARVVSDGDDDSAAGPVLVLLALAGFVLGAGVAAWIQDRGLPLMHGIVCAIGTYVVAQAVFIIVRLVRGDSVSWLAALFNLTMVGVAGAIGGGLGSALSRRGFRPRSIGDPR